MRLIKTLPSENSLPATIPQTPLIPNLSLGPKPFFLQRASSNHICPSDRVLTLKFMSRLVEICEFPELGMYEHISGERVHCSQQIFKDIYDPRNIRNKNCLFTPLDGIFPLTVLQSQWLIAFL